MLYHFWIIKYLFAQPRGCVPDPLRSTGQGRGSMGGVYKLFIAFINPAGLWSWYSNRQTSEILQMTITEHSEPVIFWENWGDYNINQMLQASV